MTNSGAGKMERSTTVIFEDLKAGRWVSASAVLRPKTPEPRIRISIGGGGGVIASGACK